jgi:hypothetical protein
MSLFTSQLILPKNRADLRYETRAFSHSERRANTPRVQWSKFSHYDESEQQFIKLLDMDNLDFAIQFDRSLSANFEATLVRALAIAFIPSSAIDSDRANLFLQRILYRINRLKLFWYDDLHHYKNERSNYVREVRDRIEATWHACELAQIDRAALLGINVRDALIERTQIDLDTPATESGIFFRDQANIVAYRRLLEIFSLDALVEASQLVRTLGGVSNPIQAMLTRMLMEEYGGGNLPRKHSSYFATMLNEMNLNATPEAYLARVPWQVLAAINHSFLLSERKRYFLRYIGGLLYTEISVPLSFNNYQAAAERLDLHKGTLNYWQLHIREDERHGQWMLHDVAIPLITQYPDDAWELLLGYDQQRLISARAGASILKAAQAAMHVQNQIS